MELGYVISPRLTSTTWSYCKARLWKKLKLLPSYLTPA